MPVLAPTPSSLLRDVPSSAAWGVHPANVPSPCPGWLGQLVSTLLCIGSSDSTRSWPRRAAMDAGSPTAGQVPGRAGGSGCIQHRQLWGKVQAKAPQTPQGLAGSAKHCPYPTLSPQGHGFHSQISVVSTPGYPKLPFPFRFSWFCRQSCALVPAQCPAGHPGVPLVSRRAGAMSWRFHPHMPHPRFALGYRQGKKKTSAACTGFPAVTRLGLGQLAADGTRRASPEFPAVTN